jgi:redox-sensitive bicupin YhaK (pirin superfamily)
VSRQTLVAKAVPMEGATVRRVLPQVGRRMVGPFTFLDHLGPHDVPPGQGFDVRPHPHIGLSTLTWLYSGELVHRDSLGSVQAIRPGEVNWMTAGEGIVHSERVDPAVRQRGQMVHGLQFWVALPVVDETMAPGFEHHAAAAVPRWVEGMVTVQLVAGRAWGRASPVGVRSSLVLADLALEPGGTLELPAAGELAIYVVQGAARLGDETFTEGTLALESAGERLGSEAGARVALFGGDPFPERRSIDWNFVSSDPQRLVAARARWIARGFPTIPEDSAERVPHPAEVSAARP